MQYVKDVSDVAQCEREALRMFSLIRNLFYDSKNLLIEQIFSQNQNIETKNESKLKGKQTKTKLLFQTLNEKLISLFAQTIEELGLQK